MEKVIFPIELKNPIKLFSSLRTFYVFWSANNNMYNNIETVRSCISFHNVLMWFHRPSNDCEERDTRFFVWNRYTAWLCLIRILCWSACTAVRIHFIICACVMHSPSRNVTNNISVNRWSYSDSHHRITHTHTHFGEKISFEYCCSLRIRVVVDFGNLEQRNYSENEHVCEYIRYTFPYIS